MDHPNDWLGNVRITADVWHLLTEVSSNTLERNAATGRHRVVLNEEIWEFFRRYSVAVGAGLISFRRCTRTNSPLERVTERRFCSARAVLT